jgi:hypothetical protein
MRLLTIAGAGRERWSVWARGAQSTLRARGPLRTWSAGRSASPLEVTLGIDAASGCEGLFGRRCERTRPPWTRWQGGEASSFGTSGCASGPAPLQVKGRLVSPVSSVIAAVPSMKVGARASSFGEVVIAPDASPGANRLRLRYMAARLTRIYGRACDARAARAQLTCDF